MRYASISFLATVGFVAVGAVILPKAWQSWEQLHAAHDPVVQTQAGLRVALTPQRLRTELESALDADDVDMASSFIELAQQEHMDVPKDLLERYAGETSTLSGIKRFAWNGFIKGEGTGATEMSGAIASDFLVVGDLRDLVTEASKPSPDQIVLGLAAAGLGVTALTWMTDGGASPARIGVSTIKTAARAGRLSSSLATYLAAIVRKAVNVPALTEDAVAAVRRLDLDGARTVARKAIKVEELDELISLGKDVASIKGAAGVRGAQETLAVARTSGDIERVAQLAKTRKGATGAVLKILGIGVVTLGIALNAAIALAGWVAAGIGYLWMLGILAVTAVRWIVRVVWRTTRIVRPTANNSGSQARAETDSHLIRMLIARRLSFVVGAIVAVSVAAAVLAISTGPTPTALAQLATAEHTAAPPKGEQRMVLPIGLILLSFVAQLVTWGYVNKSIEAVANSDSVRSNPGLAIRLLDNIDTVLDLPLYVGIFLTVLGLFLTVLFGSGGSYGAYGATMLGLAATAWIRVMRVTPLRRSLIEAMHADTAPKSVNPLAAEEPGP